jgi:hypothetical protein
MGLEQVVNYSVEDEITFYKEIDTCFGGRTWFRVLQSVLKAVEDEDKLSEWYGILQGVTSRTVFPASLAIQRGIAGIAIPGRIRGIRKRTKLSVLRSLWK